MFDVISFLFLSVVVFAGAVVAGFAGFAFSPVAGAMLLHVLPPAEAVPLMMVCSIVVQTVNLVALRRNMQWQGSLVPIVGGALGVPPALYLLQHVDASAFRIGFGCLLAAYSAYMLFRPAMARLPQTDTRRLHHAALGFAGGLLGGLTAMPGAPLTIWCDLKGMPKEQQRADPAVHRDDAGRRPRDDAGAPQPVDPGAGRRGLQPAGSLRRQRGRHCDVRLGERCIVSARHPRDPVRRRIRTGRLTARTAHAGGR